MRRYFDTVIFGLGVFLLIFGCYLVWERRAPRVQAAEEVVGSAGTTLPSMLQIPSINVRLPIFPSRLVDNNWETSKEGVSYYLSSPLPGEQGNSVMYGHNWPNLLGDLKLIKPGDEILVNYGPEKSLRYTVHFVAVVTPDQTHINTNTQDSRLTLYTCTGFLDSKRLVVTAILQD